ncbi:MAG: ABC transporter substrate-binding protein [Candidatus Bathyarchaeota archaeon]|nr:ABC transporter substrate-binding protein [Candidatus Bathyarchaeota archaeon]
MKKAKDSRKGVSTTVIVAAVILIIIVVIAGIYVYQVYLVPEEEVELKETLIMGTTDTVESAVDPAQAYDFFGWEIIQNTGCTLVDIEPGSSATPEDFTPSLATDWDVSDDGLTWDFTLRQGVYFDDNVTEFNATHVKYSFDRNIGIASPDGPQLNMEYDAIIDSVEVVSKYLVRFNLKIPFASMLGLMACQASSIVNPQYAGGWKTEWSTSDVVWYTNGTTARTRNPIDLGPYKLTKWTRVGDEDQEMELEANPNYWGADDGYPKTKKIVIKFYASSTALRTAIDAGDVDIAFRHLEALDIEDLRDDPDLTVWEGTGAAIQYLIFQEEIPPFNDSRVRRAIAAALDRPTMCETVFLDQTSPLYSIIPDGMMGHTEAFAALGDANYTLTQSLLAELGYNETNKLPIDLWYETSGHYPASEDQALIYKSSLEASDVIDVTLKSADWPSYRLNRNTGIMEVFIYGWYPDYIDPDNYAFLYYAVWLNHHYIDYGEHYAEMKAAYDAARATTVESERVAKYAEIDDYAVTDCPVVPLWQGKAFAVTKPDVQGVFLDITQTWRMWYLYAEVE